LSRQQLESDRTGHTHKMKVGPVNLYITVNSDRAGRILEVFSKADEGYNAEADGLSIMASLALQHGAPVECVVRHLRHRRYPPHGFAGQPCSISDAIGQAVEKEAALQLEIEGSK
jgi:hypothetical protein